ncbi:GNAT family N-acetyltransferase [Pseudooctadecabacter jejudonensis]|uniref:Acetyltransferase (GNAT) family protein n=1 Tax=Pseudooctadecabacter jejudonensis TaxID=1391910 RepID=A0A1Y5SRW9_9RHOB|nr:GNAT family N-acetyltransferase [Pseudooctadecabacter jejudonensis]SLN46901.1 Acetyltransferase (GNAT) family protein [Pseudooctadecabacter jejudonensis]
MEADIRNLPSDSPEMVNAFDVMVEAFAGMEGRIDPPSSLNSMTVDDLRDPALEVWVLGKPIVGTVVLTPKPKVLYVGKLAVRDRRRGVGRQLLALAERRAGELGLTWLELESRVELIEVHMVFKRLGFREVMRTTHAGYARPTSITFRKPV